MLQRRRGIRARRRRAIVVTWLMVLGAAFAVLQVPAAADVGGAAPGTPRARAAALDAGALHTCAVLDTAAVKCWGENGAGQLGLGDTDSRGDQGAEMGDTLDTVNLGTGRTAIAISAGSSHTCALLDNAFLKCWGDNSAGQLGQGNTDARGDDAGEMGDSLPAIALGGPTVRAVSAGGGHTCALLADNTVKCWGANTSGQLGLGDLNPRGDGVGEMGSALPPVDLGTGRTATAIAAGAFHTCALLDDATVKCWGENANGELGVGSNTDRGDAAGEMGDALPAVNLGTGRTALAIAAGAAHTCALLDDATVKCWGSGGSGRLGLGDTATRGDASSEMGDALPAVDLGTGRTATAIAAGSAHTCAVLDDASLKCWGDNNVGALGLDDNANRGGAAGQMGNALPAVNLGAGRTAVAVAGGSTHTCAVLDDANVKCWGGNTDGQLGQGSNTPIGDGPGEMGALQPVALGAGRSLLEGIAPPAAPTGLTVTPGNALLKASWTAPADTGGAAAVDYLVQFSADGTTWTTHMDPVSAATTATITGLTNGTPYSVRVAARNSAGLGPFSTPASGTPDSTAPAATGYLLVEEDGDLFGFGPARDLLKQLDANAQDNNDRHTTTSSILKPQVGSAKVIDLVPTHDGQGFWALLDNGVILNRGTAPAYPALNTSVLTKQVRVQFGSDVREQEKLTAMSALSDDSLWAFSTAGRILPVGGATLDADTVNDMNAILALDLHGPMVGSTATTTGAGAYLTATDGGVFTLGDATFIDSVRGQILKRDGVPNFPDQPVTDIVPDPDADGYYVAAIDGGVFAIGAPFVGSLPAIVPFEDLFAPVNGMVTFGNGYLLIAGDGGVFNFSDQPFAGSASLLADTPIIAIAPTT